MALRDQPYFPLFVQDFMTDEKLAECSAESTGVYIRIMCLMHKSEEYGTILLQKRFKQTPSMCYDSATPLASVCYDFATKLNNHLPYSIEVINRGLLELVENDVLTIEGDKLLQRRMVRDFKASIAKSEAGRLGGIAKSKASKSLAEGLAEGLALTEYEYEYETLDKKESVERKERLPYKQIIDYLNSKIGSNYKPTTEPTRKAIHARFEEKYTLENFYTVIDIKVAEWMGNEEMQKNLNPLCLFGTKFEKYLNQGVIKSSREPTVRNGGCNLNDRG